MTRGTEKRKEMPEAFYQTSEPTFFERIVSPSKMTDYIAFKEQLLLDAEEKTDQLKAIIQNGGSSEEIQTAIVSACLAIKKAQEHIK